MSNNWDLLNYAVNQGIIDIDSIQLQFEMSEKRKYLDMHCNAIWVDDAGRYNTYLPADNTHKRKLVRKKTKEEFESEIIAYYKAKEKEPYLQDVFYQWVNEKLEYGEIQHQSYDRYLNLYKKYLENSELRIIKVKSITSVQLERYIRKTIHDFELTAKGWSDLRILIKGIFKYAKKCGYTDLSITNFLGDLDLSKNCFKKRIVTDSESVFTDSEIDKITAYVNKHISIVSLGIIFAFQSGLRCGELSALKYSDLNGNTLSVNKTEVHYRDENNRYVYEVRNYTKGREGHREIVLSQAAVRTFKQIRLLNPFGEYMFEKNGERVKGKSFTRRLYDVCDAVGIPKRSLHKARKTYATKLLNAGISEKIIMNQLGHTSIETTKGYYYFNNYEKADIEKIISNAIV